MKGQYIGMVTVFVFIFIISGNIFGALLFQNEYTERVKKSTGDFNTLTEASIKGDLYLDRMEKELNYSSNIAALKIMDRRPPQWGYITDVPTKEQVKRNYEEEVREELNTQSKIKGCQSPEIGEVSVEDGFSYTAEFSDPQVKCFSESSEAGTNLEEDSIEVSNTNNSFVTLSEVAVELGNHIDDKDLPEWGTAEASADTTTTEDTVSFTRKESTQETAERKAKRKAIEDSNLAETLASDFENPDWTEIESYTAFDYRVVDRDSETTTDECGEGDDEDCETTKTYTATREVQLTEVTLNYEILDDKDLQAQGPGKRKVIGSDSELQTLSYEFDYLYSMD